LAGIVRATLRLDTYRSPFKLEPYNSCNITSLP